MTEEEYRKIMSKLWTTADETLLGRLKNDILSGPLMAPKDLLHQFYFKMYWYKYGMGGVILPKYES